MKYKMFCTDVDGTLVGRKGVVSKENKLALKKANKAGVKIIVATGRPYNNAVNLSKSLGIDVDIIAANGALIVEGNTEKVIYSKPIAEEVCKEILNIIKMYKARVLFYTNDLVFCNSKIVTIVNNKILSREELQELDMNTLWINNEEEFLKVFKEHKNKIMKAIVIDISKKKINYIRTKLKENQHLDCFKSGDRSLEVISKGVSKGKAVEIIANYYGIFKEEIISIGDNENDLSMIKIAGLGIAMANAVEELKKSADAITDTNRNNGVAKAINKYVFFD